VVITNEILTVTSLAATTTFTLTVTDMCGASAPMSARISVPLPVTSTGLVASASGTIINVTWPASAGATSYEVERRSGGEWESLASVTTNSYSDSTSVAGRTYAYRIMAKNDSSTSPYSNSDVATTRTFAAPVAGAAISTTYSDDMLAAVNSVRAAAGWPAVTWRDILTSADPLVAHRSPVVQRHILACRARMTEALQALGASIVAYTDPDLAGRQIRAIHVAEVQERAK
jgi:hypothetical protein